MTINPTATLLIFDLDGTLIDSVPDLALAVNACLTDLGLPHFDESHIRHWVGNGAPILMERVLRASGEDLSKLQLALELFFKHYTTFTCEKTVAYDGVDAGLHQLKQQGFTLAIVTNKPYQFVPIIVEKLSWQGLFDIMLGGDSLPVKKPNPAPLYHVCHQLNFNLADAFMIGDSKNDILAGQNAGIATLGLSYGYNYGQDIRDFNPTHTFDDFSDLVNFLLPKTN
ncbi:phosphoglycolate phosphatase [Moraxella macacae]|nr:phosphoglycolate phosphatase [Moraxella macacae]